MICQESLFANPAWHALQTEHRHFAISAGDACRYPADVVLFAAVVAPTSAALQELRSLLAPGESVWLIGEVYPHVVPLSTEQAAEMVALTTLTFPGFFRKRTCEMGLYCGVRSDGELIAMGGERLTLDGYREISGV